MATSISSVTLVDKQKDILRIAEGIRGHWGIETSLHWCLDVVFKEDDSRMQPSLSIRSTTGLGDPLWNEWKGFDVIPQLTLGKALAITPYTVN